MSCKRHCVQRTSRKAHRRIRLCGRLPEGRGNAGEGEARESGASAARTARPIGEQPKDIAVHREKVFERIKHAGNCGLPQDVATQAWVSAPEIAEGESKSRL